MMQQRPNQNKTTKQNQPQVGLNNYQKPKNLVKTNDNAEP